MTDTPPEMTLTVRAAGPVTVTVDGRERHEIAAMIADDWEAARRDVIAMSEACDAARGKLPLHATIAISGAVAWAGRLDGDGGTPAGNDPAPPEVQIGPCPLHAGEGHVQLRTHGNWMCVRTLRGLDDNYAVLVGLAGVARRVIEHYEAGELNAMEAFGEIEKLFAE